MNERAWPLWTGVISGAIYGVLCRLVISAKLESLSALFALMSVAFIFIMPTALGWMTVVRYQRPPHFAVALFAPWLAVILCLLLVVVFNLEGAICVAIATPVFFVFSSIGGIVAWFRLRRSEVPLSQNFAVLLLPFALMPAESRLQTLHQIREVRTERVIAADVQSVWKNIENVPTIQADERPLRRSSWIGIPDPIEARLEAPRVGAVRIARFAKGIRFDERITAIDRPHRLAFSIHANTSEIPPTSLDEHAMVGGKYFDVLSGEFELQPLDASHTRLILRSRHRLSTHFNAYAGLWTDWIMRDVQNSLLTVIEKRSIRVARSLRS